MKKSLNKLYLSLLLISVLLISALSMMFWQLKVDAAREKLRVILQTASAWTLDSTSNLQSLADRIAQSGQPLRVTFLMPEGIVLCDSESPAAEMENHAQRPEVIDALNGGIGESMRRSETLSVTTLYAAMRVSDHLILRLSYPLSEVTSLFATYIPIVVVLFLLMYLFTRLYFARFVRRLTAQYDYIRQLLENRNLSIGDIGEEPYPEIKPILTYISQLIDKLHVDLREVRKDQDMRRDYFARVSHEMKSPLTSIIGYAEMLADGSAGTPEKQARYADNIVKEGRHLDEIIDGMLDHARKEHVPEEELAPVDLQRVSAEVVESLAYQRAQMEQRIEITGEGTVTARPADVREILYNLIGNAIRYGRRGGMIHVQLDGSGFSVQDDGIGIPEEHLPRIFERFYRAHTKGDISGTGLGLAIVLAHVKRYGGQIHVQSEPGKGSRFSISFPAAE